MKPFPIDPVVLIAYLVCAFCLGFLIAMCFEIVLRRAEQSDDDAEQSDDDDALIATVDRWLQGGNQ